MCQYPDKPKRAAEMPTEVTRPSAPITQRVATPGPGSREVKPVSIPALAIIAVLVLILHIAAGAVLGHPQAHASIVAPVDEAKCPADAKPQVSSLPFD
jgi:hypothetical protein